MDRAKVLNQIINQVKSIKEEGAQLFSKEFIIHDAEYMIEEHFEAKLNPYLAKVTKVIRDLPEDEYIIVVLDTWIKELQDQHKLIEDTIIVDEYAEVLYIRQKFLPVFIDKLQDIKLEMLEREFDVHSLDKKSEKQKASFLEDTAVKPEGVAVIASLLFNQRVIRSNTSIDEICYHFASLTGHSEADIKKNLQFDENFARLHASASLDELDKILNLIKAIRVRVETNIAAKKGRLG